MKLTPRVKPQQLPGDMYFLALHTHHAAHAVSFRTRARQALRHSDGHAYYRDLRDCSRMHAESARRALRRFHEEHHAEAYAPF